MENYKHNIIKKYIFQKKHLFIGTFTYALPYDVYRTGKSLYVEYFSVDFIHNRDLSIKQDQRHVGLWYLYSRLQT